MPEGLTGSRIDGERGREPTPAISACRGGPGRIVFIESDNTDGWISTDTVVEPPA